MTAAETIDGKKVEFPTAMHGSISACVFGFGKDSSDKRRGWNRSMAITSPPGRLGNQGTVPAIARTPIRVSMRIGLPPGLMSRSLIVSKDYKEWKKILEIQQDNLPVVALFDASGKIVWRRRGTFSASDRAKAERPDRGTRG